MIKQEIQKKLLATKNLLAFSGGGDSTALFFLLRSFGIVFDIAIVDYGLRKQSKTELEYAKKIAQQHNLTCHSLVADSVEQNFEAKAREIRYNFFEKLIKKHNYTTLLTAHHLGDRLEWFLMQFTKGCGCVELVGMKTVQQRDGYELVRPLLGVEKRQLLEYLQKHNLKYFHDETNDDTQYKRNHFRHNFSEKLLADYAKGIAQSFSYLEEDSKELHQEVVLENVAKLYYFKTTNPRSDMVTIDRHLKKNNHLITKHEKELLKQRKNLLLGRKTIVAFSEHFVYIAPFVEQKEPFPKKFKEQCRLLKIEPKLRPYLFENSIAFELLKEHYGHTV